MKYEFKPAIKTDAPHYKLKLLYLKDVCELL